MTETSACSKCQKCDRLEKCISDGVIDRSHCLAGAEISSLIDSYIANSISKLIERTDNEGFVELKNLSISKEDFECQLKEAKESAMINQKNKKCPKNSGELKEGNSNSFIDKIYEFRDKYNFRSASEQ